MNLDELTRSSGEWLRGTGPESDIVMCSRIRLARNLADFPFSNRASRSEKADFLINISTDGWFDGTSEHDEHLAICRFRAVECRRSVGRAVNMGISAVIDGDGRVLEPRPVEGTEWDRAAVRATFENQFAGLSPTSHAAAPRPAASIRPRPRAWRYEERWLLI